MIIVAFIILGIFFLIFGYCSISDGFECAGMICLAFVIVLTAITGYTHITADAQKAQFEQEYNALIYECESDEARDEHGFLNKQYIDDIKSWNTTLAFNKSICKNFWLGIFYPNIFDDLDYIDYNNMHYK